MIHSLFSIFLENRQFNRHFHTRLLLFTRWQAGMAKGVAFVLKKYGLVDLVPCEMIKNVKGGLFICLIMGLQSAVHVKGVFNCDED